MKKTIRTITCAFLILACIGTTVIADTVPVYGYTYTSQWDPSYTMPWGTDKEKVHMRVADFRGFFVSVGLPVEGYQIKNVKTSSKNLWAKVVKKGVTYKVERDGDDNFIYQTFDSAYNWLGLYALKKGSYQVRFDVVDKEGGIVKSKSLKVYANNEEAVKGIWFNGKKIIGDGESLYTQKREAILKVDVAKGYKLTDMRLREWSAVGPWVAIKNGKKFRLEKSNEFYDISIFYKDKYTGRIDSIDLYVQRWEG